MSLIIFFILSIGVELQPNTSFQVIGSKSAEFATLTVNKKGKGEYLAHEGKAQRIKIRYDHEKKHMQGWFINDDVVNEEAVDFSLAEHFKSFKVDKKKGFIIYSKESSANYIKVTPGKNNQFKVQIFENKQKKPSQEFTLKYIQ